jgi:hypothetical protein
MRRLGHAERDDLGSQLRVRRAHTVIAVAVDARGWDEACEALEQLERGEEELGAAVHVMFGEAVEETAVGGGGR